MILIGARRCSGSGAPRDDQSRRGLRFGTEPRRPRLAPRIGPATPHRRFAPHARVPTRERIAASGDYRQCMNIRICPRRSACMLASPRFASGAACKPKNLAIRWCSVGERATSTRSSTLRGVHKMAHKTAGTTTTSDSGRIVASCLTLTLAAALLVCTDSACSASHDPGRHCRRRRLARYHRPRPCRLLRPE